MPLEESDLARLKEMQALCVAVEEDAEKLRQFCGFVKQAQRRYSRLGKLYHEDWLRLTESRDLTRAQRKAVQAEIPEGHDSIFWQDTVWNALSGIHEERKRLLKALAAQL